MSEDAREDAYGKCGCGNITSIKCFELQSPNTLIPCKAPLCKPACPGHRHDPGTMGYPAQMKGRTRYQGDEPDDWGFWEWVKSRCREIFWNAQKKADLVYKEICAGFPPPAPWPHIQLQVGRRIFEGKGPDGMVEVTEFSEQLQDRGRMI